MSTERNSQICDKYSRCSLMGNWYEERLNTNREAPVSKSVRKVQPNFAFEHSSGIHDLDRLTRFKQPAQDIITNDPLKKGDYTTIMKQHLAQASLENNRINDRRNIVKFAGERAVFTEYQPATVQITYRNQAKMVNPNNYSQMINSPLQQKVNPDKALNRSNFVTTYMQGYNSPVTVNKSLPKQLQHEAVKASSDIMNSLPLGKGEWSLKPNTNEQGFFRHIRSQVTDRPNHFITNK